MLNNGKQSIDLLPFSAADNFACWASFVMMLQCQDAVCLILNDRENLEMLCNTLRYSGLCKVSVLSDALPAQL